MKKLFLLKATFVLVCSSASLMFGQELELKWTTDTVLRVPESVLFDAGNNAVYVSNIDGKPDDKDGKGFISKLSPEGKVQSLEWVTGLHAPKGMGLYKNNLYVSDISRVVVIDTKTGKITNTIEVDGAQFLNDITVDKNGKVYISDSSTGKVHVLNNNKAEVYLDKEELKGPNGLLAIKDGLYVADFGSGTNYKLGTNKKLTKFSQTSEGADGVVAVGNGDFIVSNWHGEIYYVTAKGESKKLLDTKEEKINAADIEFDTKTKMLFVPTFFANTVMAYQLK